MKLRILNNALKEPEGGSFVYYNGIRFNIWSGLITSLYIVNKKIIVVNDKKLLMLTLYAAKKESDMFDKQLRELISEAEL